MFRQVALEFSAQKTEKSVSRKLAKTRRQITMERAVLKSTNKEKIYRTRIFFLDLFCMKSE